MILKRFGTFSREDLSPLHHMVTLRGKLDNLFQRAFDQPLLTAFDFAPAYRTSRSPALDLYEEGDQFLVKVELPGMKKEDIAVSLEAGTLKVSGERKEDARPDAATICRCERTFGRFERQVTLPGPVDGAKIKATYVDGVLTVTLPKAEQAKPKQIPVDVK